MGTNSTTGAADIIHIIKYIEYVSFIMEPVMALPVKKVGLPKPFTPLRTTGPEVKSIYIELTVSRTLPLAML